MSIKFATDNRIYGETASVRDYPDVPCSADGYHLENYFIWGYSPLAFEYTRGQIVSVKNCVITPYALSDFLNHGIENMVSNEVLF